MLLRLRLGSPVGVTYLCYFTFQDILPSQKQAIIVPIPKKPSQPLTLFNLRPISLQNALPKILSKLIVARLRTVLKHVTFPSNVAFQPGGNPLRIANSFIRAVEMSYLAHHRAGPPLQVLTSRRLMIAWSGRHWMLC